MDQDDVVCAGVRRIEPVQHGFLAAGSAGNKPHRDAGRGRGDFITDHRFVRRVEYDDHLIHKAAESFGAAPDNAPAPQGKQDFVPFASHTRAFSSGQENQNGFHRNQFRSFAV